MRTTTWIIGYIMIAMYVAGCGAVAPLPPEPVRACMELEGLTLPLCEALNHHNTVQLDCHARFFNAMDLTCDEAVALRDEPAMEGECLPVMRTAQPHYFAGGGGWYEWPAAACEHQFTFAPTPLHAALVAPTVAP